MRSLISISALQIELLRHNYRTMPQIVISIALALVMIASATLAQRGMGNASFPSVRFSAVHSLLIYGIIVNESTIGRISETVGVS